MSLGLDFYKYSLSQAQNEQYNIGFIIIVMATLGPFILQYSIYMKLQFIKGNYQSVMWQQQNILQKLILVLNFTVLGLFFMIILNIMFIVESVGTMLTQFFRCKNRNRIVQQKFENLYHFIFNLNQHEIECFQAQKKYSHLIFQDSIMILLNILVVSKIIHTPRILTDKGIGGSKLILQFTTTICSIISAATLILIESYGLQELFIEYLMRSMLAKLNWIPFHKKIKQRKMKQDINFDKQEFKLPFVSDAIGLYMRKVYMFDSSSLQMLTTNIMLASQKAYNDNDIQNLRASLKIRNVVDNEESDQAIEFIPKMKFAYCLRSVDVFELLHMIDQVKQFNSERQTVDLIFQLQQEDWIKLIENSRINQLDDFGPNQKLLKNLDFTKGGKPMLQICIDNEMSNNKKDQNWQLEPIMKLLLDQGLDPNVYDIDQKYCLLTYCYLQKKLKSFEIMLESAGIDPNIQNLEDQQTTFGLIYYHAQLDTNFYKELQPHLFIQKLLSKFGDQLDIHKPQVKLQKKNQLETPISLIVSKLYPFKYFDLENLLQRHDWNLMYKNKRTINIVNISEFQQIINHAIDECLMYDCESQDIVSSNFKRLQEKKAKKKVGQLSVVQFIEQVVIAESSKSSNEIKQMYQKFNEMFQQIDQDGNNLMHVTNCQFNFEIFGLFCQSKSYQPLKQIIRKLLELPNKVGETPLGQMINSEERSYFLEPLILNDLITKELAKQMAKSLIDYVFYQAIYQIYDTQSIPLISSEMMNQFYNLFDNPVEVKEKMQQRVLEFNSIDQIENQNDLKILLGFSEQQENDDHYDQLAKDDGKINQLINVQNLDDDSLLESSKTVNASEDQQDALYSLSEKLQYLNSKANTYRSMIQIEQDISNGQNYLVKTQIDKKLSQNIGDDECSFYESVNSFRYIKVPTVTNQHVKSFVDIQRLRATSQQQLMNSDRKISSVSRYLTDQESSNKILEEQSNENLDDIDNIEVVDRKVVFENSESEIQSYKKKYYLFETVLQLIIDIIAFLNFISVLIVLYELSQTAQTIYFSISVFTILCPYHAAYSTVLKFKTNSVDEIINKQQKLTCFQSLQQIIIVLPSMIQILVIFDICFMVVQIVCLPFLILLKIFCVCDKLVEFEELMSDMTKRFLNMTYMDLQGFRLQRTILQVQLGSVPQIILQSWILFKFWNNNTIGISLLTLIVSIVFATLHIVLEILSIYIQARTSGNTNIQYIIACFNGRQNWLPNVDKLEKNSSDIIMQKIKPFDENNQVFCKGLFGFSIKFEFSDESIMNLIQIITKYPKIEDKSKRLTLLIGSSINQISPDKLIELLSSSYMRINIVFTKHADLLSIFLEDDNFMQRLQMDNELISEHYAFNKNKKELVQVEMVQMGYTQVLQAFQDLGSNLSVQSQRGNTQFLFEIAFENKDHHMLDFFMDLIREQYLDGENQNRAVLISMKKTEVLFNQIFKRLFCEKILLDTQCIIPMEMQQSALYKFPQFIQKLDVSKRYLWDVMFGAFVPDIQCNPGDDIQNYREQFDQWAQNYQQTYKVQTSKQQAVFNSKFLCMFVAFRRNLILKNHKDCSQINQSWNQYRIQFPTILSISEYSIDLNDLVTVYNILKMHKVSNLNVSDIKKCDQVVKSLGLDKQRRDYFKNSRTVLLKQISNQDLEKYIVYDNFSLNEQSLTYEYTIPKRVLAIQQLQIFLNSVHFKDNIEEANDGIKKRKFYDGIDLTLMIRFCYDLGYVKSETEFELCRFKFIDAAQLDVVYKVNPKQKIYNDIGRKKFQETILDTLQENNSLKINLELQKNKHKLQLNNADLKFEFKFYKKL